jgi:ATP-dependent DNA helicase RecQ
VGRILNLLALVGGPGSTEGTRDETVDAVIGRAEARRALERSRVDMMRGYAETTRCRADFLVAYFGEELSKPCGMCDNCLSGVSSHTTSDDATFSLHSQVRHGEFGDGTVTDLETDRITVLFDDAGYKTLSLELVRSQSLLQPS